VALVLLLLLLLGEGLVIEIRDASDDDVGWELVGEEGEDVDGLMLGKEGRDKDEELDDERIDQEEWGSFRGAGGGNFRVEQEVEAREGLCEVLCCLDERFVGKVGGR